MAKKILSQLFTTIGACLSPFFGKISWTTPPWMSHLCSQAKAKPKVFLGILASLAVLVLVFFYGYHWYLSLPQPERVVAQFTPPRITPNDKVLIPDNLSIDFGVITNGQLINRSVAPLSLVGKEVIKGISITPSIPGKWLWDSDSRLLFAPSIDWPAGQTYTVTFSKDSFTRGTNMEKMHYSFKTLPFEAVIAEFKFYQDPVNPQLRQAVATINFSYPVDGVGAASLIYFGKSAHQLTLPEALALVVIPQNPTKRIPDRGALKNIRNKLFNHWLLKHPEDKK